MHSHSSSPSRLEPGIELASDDYFNPFCFSRQAAVLGRIQQRALFADKGSLW
jgi:hypothetical protein